MGEGTRGNAVRYRGGEREQGSENRAGTERGGQPREEPAAAEARSPAPVLLLPRSGVSSGHRPSFFPTVFHSGGNMIYRGQHHKQQHSLTNTQWQPRPHADTLPHYKSREVAGWEKEERERERGEEREREGERDGQRVRQIERDVEADRR